jgi:hypothetical protein
MRAIENRISYSRHTLGAQLWDDNRCSVCGVNDAWMRINIDGVWSYLCTACWAKLGEFVANPLKAPESP